MSYQWLHEATWVDCTPETNRALAQRAKHPTLRPLSLTNDFGKLCGCPESNTMTFTFHGDDTATKTLVRKKAKRRETPIFAIVGEEHRMVLSPEVCAQLFDGDTPRQERVEVEYGTETLAAEGGEIFVHDSFEGFCQRRVKKLDMTHGQFKDITKTRYRWRFKGPLRFDRMCQAVEQLKDTLETAQAQKLFELFQWYRPEEDNSEYGPMQFPDQLAAEGQHELAFQVVEAYKQIPMGEWRYFDPITNAKIERARNSGAPSVLFKCKGQVYMLVFETGAGASGSSAAIMRPTRYNNILNSIEEQFRETVSQQREHHIQQMYDIVSRLNINPRLFLFAMMTNADRALDELIQDETTREEIRAAFQRIEQSNPGNLSTRIQQFMPTLVEKFKECEIDLCTEELLDPKPLCPTIQSTLATGLSVPSDSTQSFQSMMTFIHSTQSWTLPKGTNTCDICSRTSLQTLRHCGSAQACLKCWSDTLAKQPTCPFCRQEVEQGKLVLAPSEAPAPRTRTNRKRKREKKWTEKEILEQIHKEERYKTIDVESTFDLKKWFTILYRCRLIKMGQLPRNEQKKQTFRNAVKLFKLM